MSLKESCEFYREAKNIRMGRGLGYCDLKCISAICVGDIEFCQESNTLNQSLKEEKGEIPMNGHSLRLEKREYPRLDLDLPLEYRMIGTSNSLHGHGALSVNGSKRGLLIRCTKDMPVGTKLNTTVFFSKEFQLTNFEVLAEIIWKDLHSEENWGEYQYGLRFIQIKEKDLRELEQLIGNHFPFRGSQTTPKETSSARDSRTDEQKKRVHLLRKLVVRTLSHRVQASD